MKKATSKILVAAMSLIVAIAVATGTTFAWFSMNNKVTVTGMSVTTTVDSNILIASSTAGTGMADEEAFTQGIDQAVTGILQPASTVNAVNYFYTYDANANGSKNASADVVNYQTVSGDIITVNTTDYKAYVDYVFELKAMNVSGEGRYIVLSKLNLLYDGAHTDNHAFRAAIFAQAQNGDSREYAAIGAAANAIYAPDDAAYFDNKAVASATTKASVTLNAPFAPEVESGDTVYYKITIRFWLEGEDTDCYNTRFVELKEHWTLDLKFELLANDDTAVEMIGSVANASVTGSAATYTAALTNDETARSYAWKNADGTAAAGTNNAASYTAAADGDFYCEITTVNGNVYRTPVQAFDVA